MLDFVSIGHLIGCVAGLLFAFVSAFPLLERWKRWDERKADIAAQTIRSRSDKMFEPVDPVWDWSPNYLNMPMFAADNGLAWFALRAIILVGSLLVGALLGDFFYRELFL